MRRLHERLRRLATHADVLVESFRPGTLEAWGLGWEDIQPKNPRLVWCSLSSFGSAPAVSERVAHDLNLSAMAGILDLVGGRVPRLQRLGSAWCGRTAKPISCHS